MPTFRVALDARAGATTHAARPWPRGSARQDGNEAPADAGRAIDFVPGGV
jgi:hypothetical protein